MTRKPVTRFQFKHGLCDLPEYRAWQAMRLRCSNPRNRAFPRYGGRGITVCERWREDFPTFLADMGRKPTPKHELDRIDNDGPYAPGNCRWVPRLVNDRNRRSNVWVEYRGRRVLLRELCEAHGVWPDTVAWRLRHGWTVVAAVETPTRTRLDARKRFDRSCVGEA